MIKVYQVTEGILKTSDHIGPQSWVHVTDPTESELAQLEKIIQPKELLGHVLDFDERPRILRRGKTIVIVLHFPLRQAQDARIPYITMPVSIYLLPENIVTVEPCEMGVAGKFSQSPPAGYGLKEKTTFVLNILSHTASEYLASLDDINHATEEVEERLQRSLHNQGILQLLDYQKSLVYFTTALNSLEVLLEKLRKTDVLEWSSENQEILEDVLVEIQQAVYQVGISQNLLTQMMDAIASIVSNNLNTVMKFLTAITIIISIPMLIASLYGMNVPLPGSKSTSALGNLLILSLVLSLLVVVLFRRRDWL
ncbi:MAG: magnesium transporter CorA family protein [Anaerolineales bacterium]